MRLLLITGLIVYMFAVWGTETVQNFANAQKERQDRIEQILKGE